VTVELELGDTDAARRSVTELTEVAQRSGSRLVWCLLSTAHGALLLAEGDLDGAVPLLREAAATCQRLDLPYEAAQARAIISDAARQAGTRRPPGSSSRPLGRPSTSSVHGRTRCAARTSPSPRRPTRWG
jgi:hypothetical protein